MSGAVHYLLKFFPNMLMNPPLPFGTCPNLMDLLRPTNICFKERHLIYDAFRTYTWNAMDWCLLLPPC